MKKQGQDSLLFSAAGYNSPVQSGTYLASSLSESNSGISLIDVPKGGGAFRSISEKMDVNAINGSHTLAVGLPLGSARGFAPSLALNYNSSAGNSPFGLGWDVAFPVVRRKTDRQLPRYEDATDSDVFVLSDSEDLVPFLEQDEITQEWQPRIRETDDYMIRFFRPRVEGGWMRIEQWRHKTSGIIHWRTLSTSNVTTLFGFTENSRIADPAYPDTHIFEWFISHSFDDKGNIVCYEYKPENFAGVSGMAEMRRNADNCTNLYLKAIHHGNKTHYNAGDALPDKSDFMFETVFDYGEHDEDFPTPDDAGQWTVREDAFSTFRSGFDIRTYRLCRRIFLFHKFDELPISPYLVTTLELGYDNFPELAAPEAEKEVQSFTYLKRIQQHGYLFNEDNETYTRQSLPPVFYHYQPHVWDTSVKQLDAQNAAHLPRGIDGVNYRWVDLYGEGLAGILTEQNGVLHYKRNRGNAEFTHALPVSPQPVLSGLNSNAVQVQDLDGSGEQCLVDWGVPQGFYRLKADETWENFRPFTSIPNVRIQGDPHARFIDLNGDGIPDILVTEDNFFEWHESLGAKGYGPANRITKPLEDNDGPAIVFADTEQMILLTDMTGDGLRDIVRIRNGNICYWANKGYGQFSAKIDMANAPLFDHPDSYNSDYLRIADIDGSGTTDILYFGADNVKIWLNLSGNGWVETPKTIPNFPARDNVSDLAVFDFLGTGTACIVWSTPVTNSSQNALYYIDLMASLKPHLLNKAENNMGRETIYTYAPSTKFYLEDAKKGTPWATKLPFPVHVVEKVTSLDHVRETRFVTRYSYHHGFYDGVEREFRGFGRVEKFDTEEFSTFSLEDAANVVEEQHHQPPVKTISWFHTGTAHYNHLLEDVYRKEYFTNPAVPEHVLPLSTLPLDMTTEEWWEAQRASKGILLRQEVYALDGSAEESLPYSASASNVEIRMLQPRRGNQYAVFLIVPNESIAYSYDRKPADPRISHSLTLETDELGIVTQSASVTYPRVSRPTGLADEIWSEQNKRHIAYHMLLLTDDIDTDDAYRLRAVYETKSFELLGLDVPAGQIITKQDLLDYLAVADEIPYQQDGDGSEQLRLSSYQRSYFLSNDLVTPLPLGQRESLGLGHRAEVLAFTAEMVTQHYGTKVDDAMMTAAGYVHSEGDNDWWIPTGIALYPADAATKFFASHGSRDVFGNENFANLDHYTLLVESTTNALGFSGSVVNDYRTLTPVLSTDANLNRMAVETDALGQIIKSAVMGKEGDGDGDTLDDPTTRLEYDMFNWMNNRKPNFIHSFTREQHGAANPRWQEAYAHSDGGGAVFMAKVQAEPGEATRWNAETGEVETIHTETRWVGNGRVIVNNKGNPIKTFDPYFSTTHECETEEALVATGVSPIAYYDPMGRIFRTEFPDGTFIHAEFDSWHSKTFDANDNVLASDWYADRGSPSPVDPEPASPEQRAAWLAAKHANTPHISYTDSRGKAFFSVADHGGGKITTTRSESDLLRRFSRVYDQLGREVSVSWTNMAGAVTHTQAAEKGERWLLMDVIGRLVRLWDNNQFEYRHDYDALHRPVTVYVKEGDEEHAIAHTVYGERHPQAVERNLIGRSFQIYDQAGVTTTDNMDFKGNALSMSSRLVADYKNIIDWSVLVGQPTIAAVANAAEPLLEAETFNGSSSYDALNRPISVTMPDNTVLFPVYNEANYLDSLSAQLLGQGASITFLTNQDHDARGRRSSVTYGNGNVIRYLYDPKNFRLTDLITLQAEGDDDEDALSNLHYTYDATGNITSITNSALQTHFYNNAIVTPDQHFEYDAIYRLIRASGREHAGQGANVQRTATDIPFITNVPHPNDVSAVRRYTQHYTYDDADNIKSFQHVSSDGNGNWTRHYRYQYELDAANRTNRLAETSAPGDAVNDPYSHQYQYDLRGNVTAMPHLADMAWNYANELRSLDLGGGGFAFYVYGGSGRRRRKVIERQNGSKVERIYFGNVEIYRERNAANQITYERWTTHIADNHGRIAQVDTKTIDIAGADDVNPLNVPLIRYQHSNHQHSASIETDTDGNVISFEEYHPFGTTSYRSSRPDRDFSLKRYRFCGKERDQENGLDYCRSRYYASWLGRWTSADPAGFVDGANLYRYCANNPVMYSDPSGTQAVARTEANKHLADPAQRAAAEAYLERAFTRQLRSSGRIRRDQSIDITAMRFEGEVGIGRWEIESIRVIASSDTPTPTSEPAPEGEEGEGGEGGGVEEGAGEGAGEGGTGGAGTQGGGEGPPGSAGSTAVGADAIQRNPSGFTLEVPDSFDDGKVDAYRERIRTDRGVGNRSAVPGERRSPTGSDVTDQIRHDNRGLHRNFRNSLPNRQIPPGQNIDHTVELQHIIRGNATGGADTVRPQDHRLQAESVNKGQGSDAMHTRNRAVGAGAPEDVPAGAVARTSEMGGLRNQPWVRGTLRGIGHGLMVAGPGMTAWGASQIENDAVRYGGYGAAAVEAGGVARYMHGRYALGGANGMAAGRAAMSVGGRIAMGAGGVGQALISGYMAYEDYQNGDWVAFGFDAAAAVGGVCLIAAAIVTAPAWATGLAIAGVVTGIAAGVFHLGRAFDWW